MSPASRRVRDAAEACLSTLMSLAGSFPIPGTGAAITGSLLFEDHLLRQLFLSAQPDGTATDAVVGELRRHFRYFWADPSTVLAVLEISDCVATLKEHGLGGSLLLPADSFPETVLIIRGPFGRHVWSARMRWGLLEEDRVETPPARPKPWGSFLQQLVNTVFHLPTMKRSLPPHVEDTVLVDAYVCICQLCVAMPLNRPLNATLSCDRDTVMYSLKLVQT